MHTERHAQLTQALDQILTTLKREYQPEKVILFGSMAQGDVQEWSDLDLAIIKETSLPFLQRLKQVALLCKPRVGVDFLVYTPSELEKMISDHNPFIVYEILDKGKVIYERQLA